MSVQTAEHVLVKGGGDGDEDIDHLYCCDENRSLCGLDLTDVPEVESDPERDCPLCVLLADQPCPECG